jgi:hypothetical protein
VNGWDAGVEIVGRTDERGDYFEVYATGAAIATSPLLVSA